MLTRMATTTPPQPHPDEIDQIVGPQLEADLTEAGLEPPAARAIHRSLRFVVLQLLLVLASKAEVRMIVNDAVDGLRRELSPQFDSIQHQFDSIQHQFDAIQRQFDAIQYQFEAIQRQFDAVHKRIDDIHQLLRWNLLLTGVLLSALIGLAIYDRIAG